MNKISFCNNAKPLDYNCLLTMFSSVLLSSIWVINMHLNGSFLFLRGLSILVILGLTIKIISHLFSLIIYDYDLFCHLFNLYFTHMYGRLKTVILVH